MPRQRPDPIFIEPVTPVAADKQKAAIIFMHGLADDGEAFRDLANQFQQTRKLPYLTWVLPTAPENRDLMTTAWYTGTRLTARPNPRPELDDDEDEDGMLQSAAYILKIVDQLVQGGTSLNRIVVAGFSQGCAMALLIGLTSKYAGQFAGICGLMGYLPLQTRLEELRHEHQSPDITKQPVFLCRGTGDQLVPSRYHRMCLDKLQEFQVQSITAKEHAVGHSLSGPVLQDLCTFLEGIF